MSQHHGFDTARRIILADNLKYFLNRDKMAYPLKDVAYEAGITERQLHRYMSGASEPTATVLYNICATIGVSFERMLRTESEWNNYLYSIMC